MTAEFFALVDQAFKLAKGERAAELRGRRIRRFDERGLHPYSEVWGYIGAATDGEAAGPELREQVWSKLGEKYGMVQSWLNTMEPTMRPPSLSPYNLRQAAAYVAAHEFRQELIAAGD